MNGTSVVAIEREREWTEWMRAAVDGDAEAYGHLLQSLAPVLRSMARRGLERARRGNAGVEDVVQETLLAIHLKRDTWDRTTSIGPWVTAIARYKLIDYLRRKEGRYDLPIDDLVDSLEDISATDGADRLDAGQLLDGLEQRQRAIVTAIAIEGSTAREAAERFGMSEGAVRVTLHRSLKRLSALYRRDWNAEAE